MHNVYLYLTNIQLPEKIEAPGLTFSKRNVNLKKKKAESTFYFPFSIKPRFSF